MSELFRVGHHGPQLGELGLGEQPRQHGLGLMWRR
jgi:hypothetical protein